MVTKYMNEAISALETAKTRILDAHRSIVESPNGLDWELAAGVINIARTVDEARCNLSGLLQHGVQSNNVQAIALTKSKRRGKSDYTIRGNEFIKTGSTWEHKLTKAEFHKVIQAIQKIVEQSGQSSTVYSLDEVSKVTRVARSYVYDVYTCLEELELVDKQHKNEYPITKEQADALEIENIWHRIKQMPSA